MTKGLALSDEDRLRRDVIERLMCDLSVDLSAEAARYGKTADHFRGEIEMLEPMIADGIASVDGDRISISKSGQLLVRAVCALFDRYLDRGAARHSQAV